RRGRRGGRGRGERRPETEATSVELQAQESSPAITDAPAPLDQEPVVVTIPAVETVASIETAAPVVETPAVLEAPVLAIEAATSDVEPAPQEIATPVVEVVNTDVTSPAPTLPVIAAVDLDKTLADSGLVLVQTSAPAVVAQPEPPVKLGRPRKQKALAEQV